MNPGTLRVARCALAVGGCFGAAFLAGADNAEKPPPVDPARQIVAEWAKVRSETVRLEESWRWEHALLTSTSAALREQVTRLENEKKALESGTASERDGLAKLATRNAALRTSLAAAGERLRTMGDQLVALRPWLPPRLSQALELPYRSLANPSLSPTERMQLVATMLNRCTQFDRAITYGEEVLALPGGGDGKMFEVIYWGMAEGFALDRSTRQAFLGSPGPKGWAWEANPGMAPQVDRLIAMHRDKGDPESIELPARVTNPLPETSEAK